MDLGASLALVGALFIFAISPGPGMLAITARSMSAGLRPALAMSAGMVLGDLVFLSVTLLGMTAIGYYLGEFFLFVKIVGAAYLIWMGLKLWISPAIKPESANRPHSGNLRKNFTAGLMISLGNPKVILFYLGFLPAFVDLASLTIGDGLLVFTLVTLVVSMALSGYAVMADRARLLFTSTRALKFLNRGAGTVMIGAGIVIAAE